MNLNGACEARAPTTTFGVYEDAGWEQKTAAHLKNIGYNESPHSTSRIRNSPKTPMWHNLGTGIFIYGRNSTF